MLATELCPQPLEAPVLGKQTAGVGIIELEPHLDAHRPRPAERVIQLAGTAPWVQAEAHLCLVDSIITCITVLAKNTCAGLRPSAQGNHSDGGDINSPH